ncbi:MAG: cytochrome c oxidase assembly protein [Anaerolineales bacterium]|nr:cytochrome c oxidase assembly protein [Anaerolineales bacterium]
MDPVLKAVLLSWDWRIEVIVVLALAGTLYSRGWWRLWRRTNAGGRKNGRKLTSRWRFGSYLLGLFFIALALISPIAPLGQQLFFMHMIQHLLLIMIAPPLLFLANPMPFILWGLPDNWRLKVGAGLSRLLHRQSSFRRGLRVATSPGIIWLVWVVSVIGWHDPNMYNAALRYEWVHNLEHLTFFVASMVFWWYATGAGPYIHEQKSLLGRIAFLIGAVPPNMVVGVVLAFLPEVAYTYYLSVPRLWGIDALTDQRIGGIIMWIPGSMMFLIAALVLIARMLGGESKKPRLSEKDNWGNEKIVAAPGIKRPS